MQKHKRKGQQQNFYYETDRKPKKVMETFERFWRRQQKQHNWKLGNIATREIIKGQLWHIEMDRGFVYYSYMDADVTGEVFIENGKTIMKLSVSLIPVKSKYNISIFSIPIKYKLIGATAFILLAIIYLGRALFLLLFFAILFGWEYFRKRSKSEALQKCQQIIGLVDNFAIEEEEKLDAEWERIYGKAKNEEDKIKNEDANEILQEKRK
jgi:hypothetical protein